MGFLDFFKPLNQKKTTRWKELGAYNSIFTRFGSDIYTNDVVRSCVRTLAEYSSKAQAKCSDKDLERLINERPNMYMSGSDLLKKIRTLLEINNTCFIYIERNDRNKVTGLYPIPYSYFEAVEYQNGLYLQFHFSGDTATALTLSWKDLAVVRKDYNKSDIAGDPNDAIINMLEIVNTANEGLANSIKATANLRGILKSTKAMLAPEAIKKQKDDFVADYLNLENKGGIAALDSTQEFTPITMTPITATYAQSKELRENIYRYFGVNDKVIMGTCTTEELENFYKLRIEGFLIALSKELKSKIYPNSGSETIFFTAEQKEFMTMAQKLEFFNKVVLYGGATIDEFRALLGLGHIEGGDVPIRRLDAASLDNKFNVNKKTEENEE